MSEQSSQRVSDLIKRGKEKKEQGIPKEEIVVTLDDVKVYLQEHKELLMHDKNKFTAETYDNLLIYVEIVTNSMGIYLQNHSLMMLLDNDKLAALEDEFNEHPNGIELSNFVWLMKCAILHSEDEKYELINGLIKLFTDIDINGDHHMEWSEFT